MTPGDLLGVVQATWPATETLPCGPILLRRSQGGGQRVTAASQQGAQTPGAADIAAAEDQMRAWSQPALFTLLPEHAALDAALDARGYVVGDPTRLMLGDLVPLLQIARPRLSAFDITPPLSIMAELWAAGGIGPDRLAVMARAPCAKATLLARHDNAPAGVAYVAAWHGTAMVHALEVPPAFRRKGVGQRLMGYAAHWAAQQGCTQMALAVTEANTGAQALYRGLGLKDAGHYHYRRAPK